jgi:4-amino-4-deoxy-L-arabinose transferase-like glycosyltransferase
VDWVWLTFYLAAIVVFGTAGAMLSGENEKPQFSHKLGLVVVFGTGSLGYGLFLLALFGVRPTRWPFAVLSLVAVMVAGAHLIRRGKASLRGVRIEPLHVAWSHVGSAALLILLVVFHSIVLVHALAFPLYEWDAFAIWGLKAKVIAAEGIVPQPTYFTDVSLSYSHLDYPLMVPFLIAGVYGVLGRVDDQIAKLALPLLYFGLACLVFTFSKRRLPTSMALAVAVVVMGSPVMLRWAGSGNADVPMTAFYTTSVVCLSEWGEDSKWCSCVLCGVMSAFAAFTKNEGLVLGVFNCAIMFLLPIRSVHWKRRLAGAGLCTAVFLLLVFPWFVWSNGIPHTHENYLAHLRFSEIAKNASRIPIILAEFARQIVSLSRYGLLWLILIVSAMVGWRAFRSRTTVVVWSLLLLQLGVYALIFLVTPWDVHVQLRVALDRLLLHAVPLWGLLLALHLSFVRQSNGDSNNRVELDVIPLSHHAAHPSVGDKA